MSEPNLNQHEQAIEELLKWDEQGIRNTFDPEAVVMADLYPRRFYPEMYNGNN